MADISGKGSVFSRATYSTHMKSYWEHPQAHERVRTWELGKVNQLLFVSGLLVTLGGVYQHCHLREVQRSPLGLGGWGIHGTY